MFPAYKKFLEYIRACDGAPKIILMEKNNTLQIIRIMSEKHIYCEWISAEGKLLLKSCPVPTLEKAENYRDYLEQIMYTPEKVLRQHNCIINPVKE